MRCPNCDTLLTVDMREWWRERKHARGRAVCPICGWRDTEKEKHSKYKTEIRKIAPIDAPLGLNITETIGNTKRRRVV